MNIAGNKADTVYPLMGTIKVPDEFVGKGKLQPGVRKVDSKAMTAFLESVREGKDRLGIAFQRDNRWAERPDTNPYLQSASYDGPDGKKRVSHAIFFSSKVGVQRDEAGKPVLGDDGKPVRKEGLSQVDQIFSKLDTVEIAKGPKGYFMHFVCDAEVAVTKNGLIPKLDTMEGKPAAVGMNNEQFSTTLAAKQAAAAERKAAEKPAAETSAEKGAEKAAEMEVPEGPEMG